MHGKTSYSGKKGRGPRNLTCYGKSELRPVSSSRINIIFVVILLANLYPAFVSSCTSAPPAESERHVRVLLTRSGGSPLEHLDLFFFDDDSLSRLDSYQRFESPDENVFEGVSRSGSKRVVAIANYGEDRFSWSDIQTFWTLSGRIAELKDEDPSHPVMSAETILMEGSDLRIPLTPLFSEIRLRSLSCDFSGRPYEGAFLENIRIYPVNVHDRCRLLSREPEPSWVNFRAAAEEVPSIPLKGRVGMDPVFSGCSFLCYANDIAEETPLEPFTRLVVEGTILGDTYYYPLSIPSLKAGERHIFDLVLTRLGTSGPDNPASPEMYRLSSDVVPWEVMEGEIQSY